MDNEQLDRLIVAVIAAGVIAHKGTAEGYTHEIFREVAEALRGAGVIGENDPPSRRTGGGN